MSDIETLIAELESIAARLRTEHLAADEAADLVDRCAEVAARLGAELDRQARAAASEPAPGQETLL